MKHNGTTFFNAATRGEIAKLKALLAAGQMVDARDHVGKTVLMRVAERGQIEVVRTLLTAGADPNASVSDRDSIWYGCNALIFAAQSGNAELLELLVKAGASPKCEASNGTTPLGFAMERRSARMVEILLRAGAPMAKDILAASTWNSTAEVSLRLVEAGANVNACNDLGQPVLHRAAQKGQLEVLRALIRSKAKLNPRVNGDTPLLVAIQNGHVECAL